MATIFVPNEFYCPITGELMKDPVSDKYGHTYERSAIMKWLSKSNTSPISREYLNEKDLIANIAFKKSIESMREKLSEDQLKIDAQILDEELTEFYDIQDKINVNSHVKDKYLFINFDVPNMDKRQPVDIVLCLDVSGSMGADAPIKGGDGVSVSHGISVLSLTIAAAKTILKTLNEKDNISIITYSTEANELFTDTECTEENKATIEVELDNLKQTGITNMWAGIKSSLDCLRLNSPSKKLKVIKLLTDGLPSDSPNRGYENEIDHYFKKHNFKCMINCYGFGYSLKSELLDSISRISGGDGYSFIPDSSLLGNVFIHGLSNFYTTALTNIPVKINYKNGKTTTFYVNSIKYGRAKNIVIELDNEVLNIEIDIEGKIIISELSEICDKYYNEQLYRYKTYDMLDKCIIMKKFNDEGFKNSLDNLTLEIAFNKDIKDNEYINNIVIDLDGQVKEALNMTSQGHREDWFTKWGIHYLRSLKAAYENEICNNFKDKGVSNFTGELFEKYRGEISDIFDDMPPPKATIQNHNTWAPNTSHGLQPLMSMASYRASSGGCCAKGSRIRMEDNSFKNVEDLKRGDEVLTVNIVNGIQHIGFGFIECVIVTKCTDGLVNMVGLKGLNDNTLNITPYHPVIGFGLTSSWNFPIKMELPDIIECEEMYTFVTSNRESLLIEDYIFATYGHNLKGEIIEHDYFGSHEIVKDLKRGFDYESGKIYLTNDMFNRDSNGNVCNIRKNDIMNLHMSANL
mgnify:CR=1 FL=1